MKTLELFNICEEHSIPTVMYSEGCPIDGEYIVGFGNGHYAEPIGDNDLPLLEHWAEFHGDGLVNASMDSNAIMWDVYYLATVLHFEHRMNRFKIYFYQNDLGVFICGVS